MAHYSKNSTVLAQPVKMEMNSVDCKTVNTKPTANAVNAQKTAVMCILTSTRSGFSLSSSYTEGDIT